VNGILLDTHAWIWLAVGDARLAKLEARMNREAATGQLFLSAVSVYETATIGIETDTRRRRGRQAVSMRPTVREWVRDAIRATRVVVLPMDEDIALSSALFHSTHADPFDRIIVATALRDDIRLLTADAQIIEFATRAKARLLAL
jgi:PIN domain nuclease of toxin-antitoxin system